MSGAQEKRQQWTSRLAELEGESKELEETEKKLRGESLSLVLALPSSIKRAVTHSVSCDNDLLRGRFLWRE